MIVWVVPHLLWCFHGTVISSRDVFQVVSGPLLSGGVAGLVAFAVLVLVGSALPALARLLIGSAVLGGVYALVLLFVMGQKTLYVEVFRGLRAPIMGEAS
jgi:PST family polysaccharide transporter